MFSRYFLAFCLVLFIAAVVSVSAEEKVEDVVKQVKKVEEVEDIEDIEDEDEDDEDDESLERSSIGKKVRKILKKFFKHATKDCLKAAEKKCKKHWYNPSKLIKCAKDFLSIENAACLVGS